MLSKICGALRALRSRRLLCWLNNLGRSHTIGPLARWVDLAAFWQQIVPIVPFLPVVPVCKCCAVYYLRSHAHHGMEEVIGSIPIRSTNNPL